MTGEVPQSTKTPLWRLIFDQGALTQPVIDHTYQGAGTDEDPFVINWLGTDPRVPMKYSAVARWLITFLVGIATMAVALVSSAYTGGIVEVVTDFRVSEVAILGISLFVIGFAVGPLIWTPLSEIYGRRYIFIASSFGLTACTAGSAGSQNTWTLIILRFFAGGAIADCFPAISRGLASGLYCAAPFLGPTLGP
ncbi:uncharacterized protein LDX57_000012 [Aspergillus melleus]|uniref:uncharacterized protein n=1 Tax=Aspergillus melleus TaxID=138277 RepID=UPI001E8C9F9A|nr:uncharacterized protein LDX57_000012 [Aspergillus melleus]KAH8422254.1 hypothetical protein LDX57_000012 [Aspergillus melleus]